MNAVEIEEAISALAEQPFDAEKFPYLFLQAFGNKETTLKRLRKGETKPCSIMAPQRIRTLIPEYCPPVAAFFGMASGAFAAAVPQGWTQGTRPASSSAMILPVISS
jgi:hypothetical protein